MNANFDKVNMLLSFNVKLAVIGLTCQPEIMISVMERTVESPVAINLSL